MLNFFSTKFGARLATVAFILAIEVPANAATIVNGSFETGDFNGWIPTDIAIPFDPMAVASIGTSTGFEGFFGSNIVIPSDGNFAMSNGFDGIGPATISLAQDVGIIVARDFLSFDYRAGWDLTSFSMSGSQDRIFEVAVEPSGGGAPLGIFPILTAAMNTNTFGGSNNDTGPLSALIDLTPFAGVDARINFLWNIPDQSSGPANAQLDNVSISAVPIPAAFSLFVPGIVALFAAGRSRRQQGIA